LLYHGVCLCLCISHFCLRGHPGDGLLRDTDSSAMARNLQTSRRSSLAMCPSYLSLSYHILLPSLTIISYYHLSLSYYILLPSLTIISYYHIISCYHLLLSSLAIISYYVQTYNIILLLQLAIISYCYLLLPSYTTISYYHLLLSSPTTCRPIMSSLTITTCYHLLLLSLTSILYYHLLL
jgi:hypothetical protein